MLVSGRVFVPFETVDNEEFRKFPSHLKLQLRKSNWIIGPQIFLDI